MVVVGGPQVRDAECMRLFAGGDVMTAFGEKVVQFRTNRGTTLS